MELNILEQKIADKSGISNDLIIVHRESDEGGKKGYRTFGRITDSGEIPLMFLDKKANPQPYDDISPIIMRNDPTEILYVFTKDAHKSKVATACKQIIK
jgi:hypothetical protein